MPQCFCNGEYEKMFARTVAQSPEALCEARSEGIDPSWLEHSLCSWIYSKAIEANDMLGATGIACIIDRFGDTESRFFGGMEQLTDIFSELPANGELWRYVVSKIKDQKAGRTIVSSLSRKISEASSRIVDAESLASEVDSEISMIRSKYMGKQRRGHPEEVMSLCDELSRIKSGELEDRRIPLGYEVFDRICGGPEPGDMIVVGGMRSSGKSAMAANVTAGLGMRGIPCVVFSYEMSVKQYVKRLVTIASGIESRYLNERCDPETEEDIRKGFESVASWPMRVYCDGAMNAGELRAKMLKHCRENGARVAVVDYLQLVPPGNIGKGANKEQEVAHVSATLKRLAVEMDGVVVALSQLNKDGDTRQSMAVEQDADIIFKFLPTDGMSDRKMKIDKYRNGPSGGVMSMVFHGPTMRMGCSGIDWSGE